MNNKILRRLKTLSKRSGIAQPETIKLLIKYQLSAVKRVPKQLATLALFIAVKTARL